MSLPASIPTAIIETVLGQLALLFLAGANGDPQAARQAALRCLAAYRPVSESELTLAANIICFGFHARQSLYQAAEPDQPLNQVMRLRSGAASLRTRRRPKWRKHRPSRRRRWPISRLPNGRRRRPLKPRARPCPTSPVTRTCRRRPFGG